MSRQRTATFVFCARECTLRYEPTRSLSWEISRLRPFHRRNIADAFRDSVIFEHGECKCRGRINNNVNLRHWTLPRQIYRYFARPNAGFPCAPAKYRVAKNPLLHNNGAVRAEIAKEESRSRNEDANRSDLPCSVSPRTKLTRSTSTSASVQQSAINSLVPGRFSNRPGWIFDSASSRICPNLRRDWRLDERKGRFASAKNKNRIQLFLRTAWNILYTHTHTHTHSHARARVYLMLHVSLKIALFIGFSMACTYDDENGRLQPFLKSSPQISQKGQLSLRRKRLFLESNNFWIIRY